MTEYKAKSYSFMADAMAIFWAQYKQQLDSGKLLLPHPNDRKIFGWEDLWHEGQDGVLHAESLRAREWSGFNLQRLVETSTEIDVHTEISKALTLSILPEWKSFVRANLSDEVMNEPEDTFIRELRRTAPIHPHVEALESINARSYDAIGFACNVLTQISLLSYRDRKLGKNSTGLSRISTLLLSRIHIGYVSQLLDDVLFSSTKRLYDPNGVHGLSMPVLQEYGFGRSGTIGCPAGLQPSGRCKSYLRSLGSDDDYVMITGLFDRLTKAADVAINTWTDSSQQSKRKSPLTLASYVALGALHANA